MLSVLQMFQIVVPVNAALHQVVIPNDTLEKIIYYLLLHFSDTKFSSSYTSLFQIDTTGYIDGLHPIDAYETKASQLTSLYTLRMGENGSDSQVILAKPNAVFCPSGRPIAVLPGYHTLGGSSRTTRSLQSPCPMGAYCQFGVIGAVKILVRGLIY